MTDKITPEQKIIAMIKSHIEGMGHRQMEINKRIHDLNTECQELVDERCALEATLHKIEKELEAK